MDFLERLVFDAVGNNYYAEALSPLLGEGNSIAIAPAPSNDYDHYFDGSYRQRYAFVVYAKHVEQLMAYNTLNAIAADLAAMKDIPSEDGSYVYEGMMVATDTNPIGQDEKHFVFGIQMVADIFVKNK